MPDTYQVQPRQALGKLAKRLRRENVLPANIYGRGVESVAVQLPYNEARDLMNAHGLNVLVNLKVEGESATRPVVIRQVDQEPVSRKLRHIDFYQVDLLRPIHGQVPLLLTGESPAVHQWNGILVHELAQVDVEALPADLPEHLEASVAGLTELGSHLLLKDVPLPPGVTLVTDPESIVAAIQRPRLAVEEEPAAEGEAPAAEGEAEQSEESE